MKAILVVLIAIVIILVVISFVLLRRLRALESSQGKELDNIHSEISALNSMVETLNEKIEELETAGEHDESEIVNEKAPSETEAEQRQIEILRDAEDDKQFLERFDQFVKDNIHDPELGNSRMADGMGMSRTALYNRVKALTGLSLQNYMNKVRMEYAADLLKNTELPLAEVAKKAGFSSSPYFSTAFKSYTGLTPSQYKRNN